jgi:RimJ/RimL family protein N-acetyltransferase
VKDEVKLRDVEQSDLAIFFQHQLSKAANQMAAFTAEDPTDRDAFMARWERILGDDTMAAKTVVAGQQVVGHVASFERDGLPEVTYWIGEEHWGKGYATEALSLFLREIEPRPLYARVAKDNRASTRVLEKCGFVPAGLEKGYANARGQEIEEVIMILM